MKAVLQRVLRAKVVVARETVGAIERGFLVLLGVGVGDFLARLGAAGIVTATGRFGADMQIEMVADGPVTLVLESGEMRRTA